jgi:adenosylcobinamide kinase/adenosylcobinamide-phosphate guanylyltransferase
VGELVLVTGGARSGKSRFAEEHSASYGRAVTYLATMAPAGDAELAIRIAHHRARRPGEWRTVEEPLDLGGAIRAAPADDVVLLDCLTLWVSNLLFRAVPGVEGASAREWDGAISACVEAARNLCVEQARRDGPLIAVTNEVGWGIVPGDALSRAFRDAAGLVNQAFAAAASEVVLLVSGRPLHL